MHISKDWETAISVSNAIRSVFFWRIFQHFAYCVFLTRIAYCVLRIAYDCNFHIQSTLTLCAYCVLRVAYCVLVSPL